LVFYVLLLLGLYGLPWIDLSLSFSKSPSLLKSESGRKKIHRFRVPRFSIGANPVCTRIFIGRPVSTWHDRAVHREADFNPASPAYTRGAPAQGPVDTSSIPKSFSARHSSVDLVLTGLCARRSGAQPGDIDFPPTFPEFLPQQPYFDLL
jgi:hypothetical protein